MSDGARVLQDGTLWDILGHLGCCGRGGFTTECTENTEEGWGCARRSCSKSLLFVATHREATDGGARLFGWERTRLYPKGAWCASVMNILAKTGF